jgi:hypothetical protein
MANVLVIPDLQIPFQHRRALDFLKKTRDKYKCDHAICVGDEWDLAALSKYPKDPNGLSAGSELTLARRQSKPFYAEFPTLRICESNHRQRLYKRAFEAGIPTEYLANTHEYMQCPKAWRWAFQWEQDGVIYEHGDRGKPTTLVDANQRSTVFGHSHTEAGIWYTRRANSTMFAFNVGCLIDVNAYAFRYAQLAKRRPILSCGVVLDGMPILVPMKIDSKGRYIGG